MAHDPVRLELVKNAIGSVVDEMVLTVIRIAYSSIMKDTMDLSSAFCDRHGRMIAQGLSVALHLGSIPDAMDNVIAKYGDTAKAFAQDTAKLKDKATDTLIEQTEIRPLTTFAAIIGIGFLAGWLCRRQ